MRIDINLPDGVGGNTGYIHRNGVPDGQRVITVQWDMKKKLDGSADWYVYALTNKFTASKISTILCSGNIEDGNGIIADEIPNIVMTAIFKRLKGKK